MQRWKPRKPHAAASENGRGTAAGRQQKAPGSLVDGSLGLVVDGVSSHHRMAFDLLDHPDRIRHRLDGHAGQ